MNELFCMCGHLRSVHDDEEDDCAAWVYVSAGKPEIACGCKSFRTPAGVADVMRFHGINPDTYQPPVICTNNTADLHNPYPARRMSFEQSMAQIESRYGTALEVLAALERVEVLSNLLRRMARRSVQRGRMLDETCEQEYRSRLEAKRYKAALSVIKSLGCIRLLEGHGPGDCSDSPIKCPQCIARAALQEVSDDHA